MVDPILDRLGALVHALRLTLNLSIEEAATTAGIAQPTWSAIESAEHDPYYTQVLAVARTLMVPAVTLFETPRGTMIRPAVATLTAGALFMAGCGGSTETVTVAAPDAAAASIEAPESTGTTTTAAAADKNSTKSAKSGGIKIRVLGVRSAAGLSYDKNRLPDGEPATKRQDGGRYVSVKTRLTNDSKTGIDITCAAPVEVKLLDADQREFDPDDQLYYVMGNPSCNDKLQPGFSTTMTWPFMVPNDAKVIGFQFRDGSDQNVEPVVVPVEVSK